MKTTTKNMKRKVVALVIFAAFAGLAQAPSVFAQAAVPAGDEVPFISSTSCPPGTMYAASGACVKV